jgi:hypothetical protein
LTVTRLISLHCFSEQFFLCLVYCYKEFTTIKLLNPYFVNNNVLPITEEVKLISNPHLLEELAVWLFVSMNNDFPWRKVFPIIFTFTRLFFGTSSVNNSLPYTGVDPGIFVRTWNLGEGPEVQVGEYRVKP